MAADSGMALDASVAMCAGYQSPGGRSFRKQRTVNPLIVPARYNFLYASSRPALQAAALDRLSLVPSLRVVRRQVIAHPASSPAQIAAAIRCAVEELLTRAAAPSSAAGLRR